MLGWSECLGGVKVLELNPKLAQNVAWAEKKEMDEWMTE